MSYQRIVIDTPLTAAQWSGIIGLARNGARDNATSLATYFRSLAAGTGSQGATVTLDNGAVRASSTFTFSSTGPTNNQTCTICGVTWTAKTSAAAGAAEFTRSNTASVNATNLATAINAYADFSGVVTAEAASGVCTIYCAVPGTVGNGFVSANVNLSNTSVVSFAGGSNGTEYEMEFGSIA